MTPIWTPPNKIFANVPVYRRNEMLRTSLRPKRTSNSNEIGRLGSKRYVAFRYISYFLPSFRLAPSALAMSERVCWV
jgi:hypothetical protein